MATDANLTGSDNVRDLYTTCQSEGGPQSAFSCAVERRVFLVGAKPTQQRSFQLVAAKAVYGGAPG